MSRPCFKFSPADYQRIVDAFRDNNWAKASFGFVGRTVGMDKRRIAQAWYDGAPDKNSTTGTGFPSIKSIAESEFKGEPRWRAPGLVEDTPRGDGSVPTASSVQTTPAPAAPVPAPAAVTTELVTAPKKSRAPITQEDILEHAQEALASELRAIATVRDAAIGAAVSARKVLGALQGRIDRYAEEVAEKDRQGVPVDGQDLTKMLHRILIVAEKASVITDQTIKSERLALGSPTEIIKLQSALTPTVDAEATKRSERALAFLAGRAKARGEQRATTPPGTIGEAAVIDADDGEDPLEVESKQVDEEEDSVEDQSDEADGDPVPDLE